MGKTRAVGIDVSARTLHVAAEGRAEVATFSNDLLGFKKLTKFVTKGRIQEVRIVVEATGSYHLDLALHLDEHKKCKVMVVNPRVSSAFHAANSGRAKTDHVDARSLLAFALRMEFQPWLRPSTAALELRATGRYVDQLTKRQARLKNQLEAATATSTTPKWVLEDLAEQSKMTQQWVAIAKKKLIELAKTDEDTADAAASLETIPGFGATTAAQLVSEFAFLDPNMTTKQITAWAGLDPLPRESGTSVRGRRGMSKRGNARVRQMLYMSALSAGRAGPLRDLKERVARRSGNKMVGLGAVMRKLLTIAWAVYRTRSVWDADKARPRQEVGLAA